MGGIGGPELLIVFLVVLVVFGPKRIPEVARGLGRVIGNVRRLSIELQRDLNLAEALDERKSDSLSRPPAAPPAAPPAVPPAPPPAVPPAPPPADAEKGPGPAE